MTAVQRQLIILGAGAHARVLVAGYKALGKQICKCLALERPSDLWPSEVEWVGDDSKLAQFDPDASLLINGIGTLKAGGNRTRVYEEARARGFVFASFCHPAAIVDHSVRVEEGAQVMAGAVIQPGTVIGQNTLINAGAVIDHDCVVDAHVHVAPGVSISGSVRINRGVHIGTGASIIQSITIGENVTVGAGAVVLRDVAQDQTVVGVPARPINR